jgi:hypothetical protein
MSNLITLSNYKKEITSQPICFQSDKNESFVWRDLAPPIDSTQRMHAEGQRIAISSDTSSKAHIIHIFFRAHLSVDHPTSAILHGWLR